MATVLDVLTVEELEAALLKLMQTPASIAIADGANHFVDPAVIGPALDAAELADPPSEFSKQARACTEIIREGGIAVASPACIAVLRGWATELFGNADDIDSAIARGVLIESRLLADDDLYCLRKPLDPTWLRLREELSERHEPDGGVVSPDGEVGAEDPLLREPLKPAE